MSTSDDIHVGELTPETLAQFLEIARRDDAFKIMVPSDVRRFLGEITRLTAALASETKARQEAEASCAAMVGAMATVRTTLSSVFVQKENPDWQSVLLNSVHSALATLPARSAAMMEVVRAFDAADAGKDWEMLNQILGYSAHGKFWRDVLIVKAKPALSRYQTETKG